MIDHPDREKMVLHNISFSMDKKKNPNSSAPIGIIIGLNPSTDTTVKKDMQLGVDASRPDLWIYGENFSILIENKIVGSLNPQQLANHRSKFPKGVNLEITRTQREVSIVLSQLKQDKDRIESYLIEQFINFLSSEEIDKVSHRKPGSNGIFSRNDVSQIPHFEFERVIPKKKYRIYKVNPLLNQKELLTDETSGPIPCRKWVAKHVNEHYKEYMEQGFITGDPPTINERCSHDNKLGQWYLETFIQW